MISTKRILIRRTNIKLIFLNFLEFFALGSWLLSAGTYMLETLNFSGLQVGSIYATMGIASLFMPPLMGMIADRWLNSQKLFVLCHFVLFALFLLLPYVSEYKTVYLIIFLISSFFMPTIVLNNSISFSILSSEGKNVIKAFPFIRIWGTIGFVIAAWLIDLMGWKINNFQFYISAFSSLVLAFYALFLPTIKISKTWKSTVGIPVKELLRLFQDKELILFLSFSILIGVAMQMSNIWGVPFLSDFGINFQGSFVARYSIIMLTISQLSEIVFVLFIPFFFKNYGIKPIMLISMMAWVFRFGLFAVSYPEGVGLMFLILSMIAYGMAFDFFGVSGSLYIEQKTSSNLRSSAQGLFMMMVSGLGPILGSYGSGYIIDLFTYDGVKDWTWIWLVFAFYALLITLVFIILFNRKIKVGVSN